MHELQEMLARLEEIELDRKRESTSSKRIRVASESSVQQPEPQSGQTIDQVGRLEGYLGDTYEENYLDDSLAVDHIDFLMYAVSSLLVEALELQVEDLKAKRVKENEKRSKKRSRKGKERAVKPNDDIDNDIDDLISCLDQTSEALTSLSLVCQIPEKLIISSEGIAAIDHHTNIWHAFLHNFVGTNNFTINQHYMLHISYFIQQLGSLKAYSARSLERTIGLCKPGENAINFLRDNSVQSQQKWYAYKESNEADFKEHFKSTSDLLNDMLDPDGLPFNVMLRDFCSSNRLMFDYEETKFIREEYILTHNNQILKKTRGKVGIDVVVERNSESGSVKYGLVNIQAMFDYKNTNLALVKDGCSLELD
ncbi:hypothetical protein BDF21DRAFT_410450 [Thamnidium elegans]|nr:hypothetical protein BDF21DRAFT_410450 [Thamnidium elegans]